MSFYGKKEIIRKIERLVWLNKNRLSIVKLGSVPLPWRWKKRFCYKYAQDKPLSRPELRLDRCRWKILTAGVFKCRQIWREFRVRAKKYREIANTRTLPSLHPHHNTSEQPLGYGLIYVFFNLSFVLWFVLLSVSLNSMR